MTSFEKYILKQQYKNVAALGDKLSQVDQIVNWNHFSKIVEGIFDNTSKKGGRPSIDPIIIIKLLLLQVLYSLFDWELLKKSIDDSKYSQRSTQNIKTIDRKLKIGVNYNSHYYRDDIDF